MTDNVIDFPVGRKAKQKSKADLYWEKMLKQKIRDKLLADKTRATKNDEVLKLFELGKYNPNKSKEPKND